MEMHQLRYFAKVADLGNVTRAAEACHVSQPSLSQQIAKLERELGQPLFERLGRGVRLTEAGRMFKRYSDQILSLTEDARTRVSDEPDSGRITVAAIPTIAPYYLPGILTRFGKECPRARVEIVEETTGNILRLLAEGDVDLAILALPIQAEHVHTRTLFTEELLAVVPADHPLAKKPRVGLKDLVLEPFVVLNEAHCLTGATMSFCARHSASPLVTAKSHQLLTVLELVRLGQGVSLIPAMAVPKGRDDGREYRSLTGDKPTRTIALAWNRMRYQTQLFKRFVEFVSART
ncbi:MAG: LysR family transcriptional regulator [Vicinamibacteria bacterium]|nr:LysR family transcriptional regulator [Vicinamibacteria bacterium]